MRADLSIALTLGIVFELRLVHLGTDFAIGRDSRIVGITISRNIGHRELIDAIAMDLLISLAVNLLLEVCIKEDACLALLNRRKGVLHGTSQLGFTIGCFAAHLDVRLDVAVVLLEGITQNNVTVTIKL